MFGRQDLKGSQQKDLQQEATDKGLSYPVYLVQKQECLASPYSLDFRLLQVTNQQIKTCKSHSTSLKQQPIIFVKRSWMPQFSTKLFPVRSEEPSMPKYGNASNHVNMQQQNRPTLVYQNFCILLWKHGPGKNISPFSWTKGYDGSKSSCLKYHFTKHSTQFNPTCLKPTRPN